MGCGRSKLDPDREAENTGKIPPLLRRRIDEIKRKRNAATVKSTLSKKQLLKEEGTEEDDNSGSSCSKESIKKAMVAPESQSIGDSNKDEKVVEAVSPTINETEEQKEKEGGEESEEDEGRLSSVNDALICPGSPSFRVYCVDQSLETTQNEDDGSIEKSKIGDSCEIVSVTSEEGSPDKLKKKKKARRFRMIPRGSKNFLNVKGCYNPSFGGHDKHHLLHKAVA